MPGIQAGGNAGRLGIEIVAEQARLQQDMDRIRRLIRDASGDIAKNARIANDNLAGIGKGAGAGLQSYSRDIAALKAQLDPAWAAQQKFNDQQRLGITALKTGAIDRQQFIAHMRTINAELKGLPPVQDRVTNGVRQQRQGFQQLGYQMGDFSTQVSSGTSITQAFAQQIGQTSQALQLMGGGAGALGRVAGFLSGGWGIALTVALPLMATFISKLFQTKKATDELKVGAEDAAKSIRNLFDNIGRSSDVSTAMTKASQELITSQATLYKLRQRLKSVEDSPNKSQNFLLTQLRNYIPVLEAEVRKREANIDAIRMATDVMKMQERQVARNQAADEAASKALRDRTAVVQQYGREVSLAAAKSIAVDAGMRVTSGLRSRAEQQWLYDNKRTAANPVARPGTSAHERGGALDIAYGAGVTVESIRKAYAEAGVRLTKILRETGHFHIEWSTTGADKAEREVAKLAETARKEAKESAEEFDAMFIRMGIGGQKMVADWFKVESGKDNNDLLGIDPAVAQAGVDKLNEFYDGLQRIRDLTPEIRLSEVFGEAGDAIEGMIGAIGRLQKAEAEYQSLRQKVGDDDPKRLSKMAELETERGRARVGATMQMLGASKKLFKEESAGYKVIMALEKAMMVMEMVNTIKSITLDATKTTSAVANSTIRTGANVAEGSSKMFGQLGIFGFVAVAAMLALMAGLGFKGRGGSSAPAIPTADELQEAAGTGSVLGDGKAKSNSIANSLEIVAANTNKDLEYSNDMLRALRSIDTGISKLAGNVARQITVAGGMFDTSGQKLGSNSGGGFLGMFSTTTTRSLWDVGMDIFSSSVADILQNGIGGRTYQIIEQIKKKSGFLGIGGSTKTTYQTSYGEIDSSITEAVNGVIYSLREGLIQASKVVGLEGAAAIIDNFRVEIGRVSFKDMSGEEIEQQLNAIFSKVGDQMAGAVLPGLKEMQKVGEGLFETYMRVARQYQVIDISLKSVGMTFGAVGVASLKARDDLVQLFGSLDDFTEQVDFYRENFLTEAEQMAPIMRSVADEMVRLGLSSIDTIDEFKGVVAGIDLTTEAGRELFAAMMAVAPAFSAVEKYQDKMAKAWEDRAKSLTEYRDNLVGASGATSYAAIAAQYRSLAALAGGGDADALDGLKSASDKFLEAAKANATSELDVARARAEVLNNIDGGVDAANEQATLARRSTAAVEATAADANATTQLVAQLTANVAALNRKIDAVTDGDALRIMNDDDTPLTVGGLVA